MSKLSAIGGLFDLEKKKTTIKDLEKLTFEDGFWSDKRKSSEIIKNMNFEKNIVSRYEKLATEVEDEEV